MHVLCWPVIICISFNLLCVWVSVLLSCFMHLSIRNGQAVMTSDFRGIESECVITPAPMITKHVAMLSLAVWVGDFM